MSAALFPAALRVIDSHTEGEPTRVVVDGWPALQASDMPARARELVERWDHLRSGTVCEPRGHDAMVGALLVPPVSPDAAAGVIFFNNVGCLGMCGHGMIGVVRTLAHLGRVTGGCITIDTPAGTVRSVLEPDGSVTIRNVPAHCHALDVSVDVPGYGTVRGDIAWGGNWFYIIEDASLPLELRSLDALLQYTRAVMRALADAGIAGSGGAPIDHVELSGPAPSDVADATSFVLCPGGAYDRSPCGTGTSAKLAVLHARGALQPGATWRARSITGGIFTARLEEDGAALVPVINGRAWITAEAVLHFGADDPFRTGFTSAQ